MIKLSKNNYLLYKNNFDIIGFIWIFFKIINNYWLLKNYIIYKIYYTILNLTNSKMNNCDYEKRISDLEKVINYKWRW